jgi:hypothetical protein
VPAQQRVRPAGAIQAHTGRLSCDLQNGITNSFLEEGEEENDVSASGEAIANVILVKEEEAKPAMKEF